MIIDIKSLKVSYIEIIGVLLSLIPLMLGKFNTTTFNILVLFFFIILNKEIDTNEVIKMLINSLVIGVLFYLFLYMAGFTSNYSYVLNGRVRNTFGFNNVNAFSSIVYSITMFFLVSRNRIKIFTLILLIISNYIIFKLTDSRSGFYSLIIYMVLLFVQKILFSNKSIKNNFFVKSSFLIILNMPIIISVLFPFLIKSNTDLINKLTSNRLSLFKNYIDDSKIINFVFGASQAQEVDNAFLVMLLTLGVGFFIYFILMVNKSTFNMYKLEKKFKISFVISFLYFSIFEGLLIRPEYILTILFWIIIFRYRNVKKESIITNY